MAGNAPGKRHRRNSFNPLRYVFRNLARAGRANNFLGGAGVLELCIISIPSALFPSPFSLLLDVSAPNNGPATPASLHAFNVSIIPFNPSFHCPTTISTSRGSNMGASRGWKSAPTRPMLEAKKEAASSASRKVAVSLTCVTIFELSVVKNVWIRRAVHMDKREKE